MGTITKRQTYWRDHVLAAASFDGTIVEYAALHSLKTKLTVYTTDGRLRIDNNLCENAVRPFVIPIGHKWAGKVGCLLTRSPEPMPVQTYTA